MSVAHGIARQGGEVALHLAVPLHARDRAPPPTLHVAQRRLVVAAPGRNCLAEVTVLGFDDFVRVLADEGELTRSSELAAGHRLHGMSPWLWLHIESNTLILRVVLSIGTPGV